MNSSKIREVNEDHLVAFYYSIGYELIYYQTKSNRHVPGIRRLSDGLCAFSKEVITKDKHRCIFESCLMINDILYEDYVISKECKEILDTQVQKYMNCTICCS